MSDWQVGDLAVCVDAAPRSYSRSREWMLVEGRNYRVMDVCIGPCSGRLALVVTPDDVPSTADRFRKIRPDEQEACEPEFVTLLKRSKRKVSA